MKICIYGGSFNPITKAHVSVAKQCTSYFDEVWLLPSYISVTGKKLVDSTHRLNMCTLAITNKGISIPKIRVCDFEIKNKLMGETVDNLLKLYDHYGPHDYYFLMGYDVYNDLAMWPSYGKFIKNINICLIPREGYKVKRISSEHVLHYDNVVSQFVSSTEWREKYITSGINNGMVSDDVFEYIVKNKLYLN